MSNKLAGRPKAHPDRQTFIVRFPQPLAAQLRAMAQEEQRTITAVMQRLVQEGLAKEQQAPAPARAQ